MIRRFREGKPAPREARSALSGTSQPWWQQQSNEDSPPKAGPLNPLDNSDSLDQQPRPELGYTALQGQGAHELGRRDSGGERGGRFGGGRERGDHSNNDYNVDYGYGESFGGVRDPRDDPSLYPPSYLRGADGPGSRPESRPETRQTRRTEGLGMGGSMKGGMGGLDGPRRSGEGSRLPTDRDRGGAGLGLGAGRAGGTRLENVQVRGGPGGRDGRAGGRDYMSVAAAKAFGNRARSLDVDDVIGTWRGGGRWLGVGVGVRFGDACIAALPPDDKATMPITYLSRL